MAGSSCQCPNCDAEKAHKPNRCRRKARWFIHHHPVDRCKEIDGRKINVCQDCFDAHIDLAVRTIDWGMAGARSTSCLGCNQPLVRLSAIVRDVAKV